MILCVNFFSLLLSLLWFNLGVQSQFPTHPFAIPSLYTADTDVSHLPFGQLSHAEQEQHLQFLSTLDQAARTVAGVFPPFMPHSMQPAKYFTEDYYESHLSRSVVVTIANMGYLPHLQNFACFAKRLNLHFLVLAVDDSLYEMLSKSKHESFQVVRYHGHFTADRGIKTSTSAKHDSLDGTNISNKDINNNSSLEQAAGFQTQKFNLISLRKFEAVYDLQRLGYDVLFVDVDVILLQDVFPLFLRPGLRDISYMHSMNQICSVSGEAAKYLVRSNSRVPNDGNTGFHFFQHPSFAQERLQVFYQTEMSRGESSVNNLNPYSFGVPRPAAKERLRDFYRRLLQVTEKLPVLQMLHIFLKDIPHDTTFNPHGNFDDQTMFWLFIRSLRSEQNRNTQLLLNKKKLHNSDKRHLLIKTDAKQDGKLLNYVNEEQYVEDNEEAYYYNREVDGTNDVLSDAKKDSNNNLEEKEEEEADQKPHFHRFNSLNKHLPADENVNENGEGEEEETNNSSTVVAKEPTNENEDEEEDNEGNNFEQPSSPSSKASSEQTIDTAALDSELLSVETHDHKNNNSKPQHFLLDTATVATSSSSSSSGKASLLASTASSNTRNTEQTEFNTMDVIKSIFGGFASRSSNSKTSPLLKKQPTELDTEENEADEDENIPHFHTLKASKSLSKHHAPLATQPSEKVLDDDNVMNSLFLFSSVSNTNNHNHTNNSSSQGGENETYHLRGTSAFAAAKAMREKNTSYFDILLDLVVQDRVTINISNKKNDNNDNNNDNKNNSRSVQRQLASLPAATVTISKRNQRASKVSPSPAVNKRLKIEAQKEIGSILSLLGIQNAKDINQKIDLKGKPIDNSPNMDVNLNNPKSNVANKNNNAVTHNFNNNKSKPTPKPRPASANHFAIDSSANEEILRSFLLVSSSGTCQSTHLGHSNGNNINHSVWSTHPNGKAAIEICALNNCQVAPAAFLYFTDLVKLSLKRMNKKFSVLANDNGKKTSSHIPVQYLHRYPKNQNNINTAEFKLTATELEMLQLVLHEHDLPSVKSIPYSDYINQSQATSTNPNNNSHDNSHNLHISGRKGSYLYALHGNYVTGETEKKQYMREAGFWLVPPPTSLESRDRLDFGMCLTFAHKPTP